MFFYRNVAESLDISKKIHIFAPDFHIKLKQKNKKTRYYAN